MESIDTLKAELAQALADAEQGASLAEINQTLADMLDWMKSRKAEVQAPPAPPEVTVHNHVTAQPDTQIDHFTHEYNAKGQLVKSVPHRSPRKGA
jgi:hypothetical protein